MEATINRQVVPKTQINQKYQNESNRITFTRPASTIATEEIANPLRTSILKTPTLQCSMRLATSKGRERTAQLKLYYTEIALLLAPPTQMLWRAPLYQQ